MFGLGAISTLFDSHGWLHIVVSSQRQLPGQCLNFSKLAGLVVRNKPNLVWGESDVFDFPPYTSWKNAGAIHRCKRFDFCLQFNLFQAACFFLYPLSGSIGRDQWHEISQFKKISAHKLFYFTPLLFFRFHFKSAFLRI